MRAIDFKLSTTDIRSKNVDVRTLNWNAKFFIYTGTLRWPAQIFVFFRLLFIGDIDFFLC